MYKEVRTLTLPTTEDDFNNGMRITKYKFSELDLDYFFHPEIESYEYTKQF